MSKEKLPLTCEDPECGRDLTEDETVMFYDEIEHGTERPYCFACMSKMKMNEQLVDDSLMEGK